MQAHVLSAPAAQFDALGLLVFQVEQSIWCVRVCPGSIFWTEWPLTYRYAYQKTADRKERIVCFFKH